MNTVLCLYLVESKIKAMHQMNTGPTLGVAEHGNTEGGVFFQLEGENLNE